MRVRIVGIFMLGGRRREIDDRPVRCADKVLVDFQITPPAHLTGLAVGQTVRSTLAEVGLTVRPTGETIMSIIEQIKERTDLAALVGQSFTLAGREGGRTRSTVEHDSLVIWVESQTWRWFSRDVGGDCLDWYQYVHGCDLGTAIEALAAAAGVERRPLTAEEQAQRTQQQRHHAILRIAAEHYHHTLLYHPQGVAARSYTVQRGWTIETLQAEMIGCTLPISADVGPVVSTGPTSADNNHLSLDRQLRQADLLDHPTARAVLSMPPDMLIYAHRRGGQVTSLSGRSIEGKRHYHLPGQPTPLYYNNAHFPNGQAFTGHCLLVEGQADAISLTQYGMPAVALCGLQANELATMPNLTAIALDADEPGRKRALEIAQAIDPMLPIVEWQAIAGQAVKDANDALRAGLAADGLFDLIHHARPALLHMAEKVRKLRGDGRMEAQRQVLDAYIGLDELEAADLRPGLATALGIGVAQLNNLVGARKKETEGEKPSPTRYEYSAGGARGGLVWEQCVVFGADGSAQSVFAVRGVDGKISMRGMVDVGDVTYTPYPANTGIIDARVVLFPEKPQPYGSQRQLVRTIQDFIHRYLDIDPFYERLAAYYVLFSWVYDMFENLPYLRALGDYGTGKTRFLQAIGVLCYRPMFVSGASSVSPIFRLIDMFRGTLIIDEADFANSDADAEIVKILNVGYYRTGIVLRSEKDPATNAENWSPQVFRVFGPKLLATRKPFTDRATESRCLTRRMTSARPRPDISYILGPEFWADATAIRNQILQYRLEKWRANVAVDPALADDSVEPRLNQVTMALKSIVDDAGMRGEIDGFIRAYNATIISDRQMSLPALVVQALAEIHFSKKVDLMGDDVRDFTMKGLADATRVIAAEIDPEIRVHPRTVSHILSEDLGLPRRRTCSRTRRAALEYSDGELAALMQRYGIDPPVGVESGENGAEMGKSEG